MARHNRVSLLGVVEKAPRIVIDNDGNYVQGLAAIKVVRGERAVGDKRTTTKYDLPLVWSFDSEMVELMNSLVAGDIVDIKGTISTKPIPKSSECKHCHTRNSISGVMVYVNPIHILKIAHFDKDEEIAEFLRRNSEISNEVLVLGTVLREPKKLTPLIGLTVTQYPIALNRKLMIPSDPVEIRTDYPWVKSYGENALSDKKRLKLGSEILIDGCLQARNIMRHHTCEACGQKYEWKDNAMEIVPYATEYLTNYYSDEDLAKMEEERIQQALDSVFSKKRAEDDDNVSEDDLAAGIDPLT